MTKHNLLRVTQINALYFDNEIYKIFREHIEEIFKYLPSGFISTCQPELNLLLKLALLNYSVVKNDKTFGQKLLSIKYSNFTYAKKILYVLANCWEYFQQRAEILKLKHYEILTKISQFLLVANFINVSLFLRTGRYPQLIERILSLEQVYEGNNARIYNSKYMTRELLWNGLIEMLVYVLPLINYHKISRIIRNLNPVHVKEKNLFIGAPIMNLTTKCAYCNERPVHPRHMGCSHIFCYSCLKGNQIADSKYECPICGYTNLNVTCTRVAAVV